MPGLTPSEIKEIKKELDEAKNPLYFFHDDADGLASFLLLYRYIKEGHGIVIKTTPKVDEKFLRKVEEYKPDKIFILDIAMVDQEFIDKAKTKIIWIDHHEPAEFTGNVKYYNPRIKKPDAYIPATYLCYQVVKNDLWIASIGAIGDWYMPDYAKEFAKKYPKIFPKFIKDPEVALFTTEVGKFVDMFGFILKGKTNEVMKSVKTLTRIKEPDEIMEQKTSAGKFIYKKYEKINKEYQKILEKAIEDKIEDDKLIVFTYVHDKISFTKNLANEMSHRFPNKIVIIGREKSGEVKLSLRSKKDPILPVLKKALEGVEGYGGGHELACGANIKKYDFDKFIDKIRKQL
jgi:single-stranded DNA-specific DHH superfamily exonuclease